MLELNSAGGVVGSLASTRWTRGGRTRTNPSSLAIPSIHASITPTGAWTSTGRRPAKMARSHTNTLVLPPQRVTQGPIRGRVTTEGSHGSV